MKTLIICTAMLASLLISTVRADMIPDIISTTAVYDVGVHTVALNTVVLPGAELRLTAGATVMFMTATSRLVVSGALHAVSATLTAQSLVTRWGGIVVSDGATAQLYQCTLERAGAFDMEPVTAYRAHCANSVISNCYATDSARNAFVFEGGNAVLWDNHATVTSGNAAFWIKGGGKVVWRSTHNTMNGTGFPGIYVDGLFTDDVEFRTLDGDRLYCNSVIISNGARIVFPAGAFVGFGFVNSQLELHDGARMEAIGTPGAPIVFTDYAEATNQPNRWAGLHFANATGILTYVTTQRAIGHTVSDGVLTLSNVCMLGRSGSAIAANRAVVTAYQSEFSGCVGRAVTITNFSTAFFRECIFRSNNPPYAASFYSDLSTRADVRFCWWNAADGPYPFGAYGNELVNTNADAVFFPWLLAAPGSQTNPPYVKITSQTEPFSTPAAQVIIQGIATDATRVVRLALRNDRCPITHEPS
ncbi:MAG: hypothetical protein NTV22_03010, partial [bacterium]|nr:hypothetical protein [bacterium]